MSGDADTGKRPDMSAGLDCEKPLTPGRARRLDRKHFLLQVSLASMLVFILLVVAGLVYYAGGV